jgi:hypothetical protein
MVQDAAFLRFDKGEQRLVVMALRENRYKSKDPIP